MSYPSNWRICKLPEVVYFQEGTGLRKFQYRTSGIPFLNIRTLLNGRVNRKLCQYISTEEVEQKYKHFLLNEGDIICSTSGTLGKTAVIHAEDLPLLLNTSVMRFRSLNEEIITQKYIHLYLKSDFFINQAINASTGSAQVNVGPTHMKTFDIPVPPLNEQKRITEKLDSLLARVDSCQTHLERVPQILKRFRQSVLAAATSGRLTEDWRDKRGQSKGNISFDFMDANCFGDYEFPDTWKPQRLKDIADVIGGITKDSKKQNVEDEELPYLRVANVQRGYLDLTEMKTIRVPKQRLESWLLKPGDILFNEGGDIDKLGRGWVWNGEIERCIFQNHVFRARLKDSTFASKYFSHYGNSRGYDYFLAYGKQTTNLASINKTIIEALPVAVPPPDEQTEIVRRVEKLFAYAERLEARYYSASEHVERLTPSLLAKAFRGELVEQDAGDESAEELVERIREERKDLAASPKIKRGKRG